MKKLKDLKDEFLNNKFNNFYVFYGEDYGLRKHYINAIKSHYDRVVLLDDYKSLFDNKGSSLIITRTLFILYDCEEFCNLHLDQIKNFIKKLKTDCVVLDFELPYEKSVLFKEFGDYITYFPLVDDKIGQEFVKSEIVLSQKSNENIAYNCFNNYNKILLETDKIKDYSNEKQINTQQAYDILLSSNQLNIRVDKYNNDLIVNDLLTYNAKQFSMWEKLLTQEYPLEFWYNIARTTNDFIIAYYVKRYGKWDGSRKAYEYGLPWNRTKDIRELKLCYDYSYYLYYAYELSDIDYKVKTGKLKQENVFSYFLYTIM